MARKPAIAIQETIETNEDYEHYLETHADKLICMEVYSEFCGPCLATANAIRKGKMEIGQDNIAMVKCPADNIDALKRFQQHSEPAFLFIVRGKLIRAIFGPNGIDLCRIIEEELKKCAQENEGIPVERELFEIDQMLPEEAEKLEENLKQEEDYKEAAERIRVLTLAARKKRVNERLSMKIKRLNFIMFWPHCHKAHYDLYEKWDNINITVAAKETIQMDEHSAREALYMSDVDPNEACLHALFDGEALIVLFKMFDTDTRDFVRSKYPLKQLSGLLLLQEHFLSVYKACLLPPPPKTELMRYSLYEEIPIPKEDVPPENQVPPVPAYERYASISKTAREIRRDRYNAKLQKLQEEKEEADRLASEQARLAREAAEEEARLEKTRQDEERMARIAAGLPADLAPVVEPESVEGEQNVGEEGDVTEGGGSKVSEVPTPTLPPGEFKAGEGGGEEVSPDEVVPEVTEEKGEEEFDSDVEVEGEDFIPAGGLFVPGLYTPANELAKACGLAFFFPKHVKELAETIETEFLPPHILVIFPIEKRYDVLEVISNYSSEILNMGVFVGEDPYKAEHIAYTIKQYDKIKRPRRYYDRLALMVSRKRSLPLLQLASCSPVYLSSDVVAGERECLAMFPVGYGDDYFEEESDKEEEVAEVVEEKKAEDEEEEDEEAHEATL